jgi:hypothetical protein
LNPLIRQKARTKNQQLTPKVFPILKCSNWNIQHKVPSETRVRTTANRQYVPTGTLSQSLAADVGREASIGSIQTTRYQVLVNQLANAFATITSS